MVGRYSPQEGTEANTPVVRYGHIALMNKEPLKHEYYGEQESFMVEMRSIGGYSGSPVMAYKRPYSPKYGEGEGTPGVKLVGDLKQRLLGMDWGHFDERVLLEYDVNGHRVKTTMVAKRGSAMAGVVPAWHIMELLMHPKLVEARKMDDERIDKESSSPEAEFVLDSDFTPGLKQTLPEKLESEEAEEVDPETFLDTMQHAAAPETAPEPDDESS